MAGVEVGEATMLKEATGEKSAMDPGGILWRFYYLTSDYRISNGLLKTISFQELIKRHLHRKKRWFHLLKLHAPLCILREEHRMMTASAWAIRLRATKAT
jgi:hypothetical protein